MTTQQNALQGDIYTLGAPCMGQWFVNEFKRVSQTFKRGISRDQGGQSHDS